MLRLRLVACAAIVGLSSAPAGASYHAFQIEQIYSNADGSVQFVVLHESEGLDGENLLGGHTLTASHAGTSKTYRFDHDLGGASVLYGGVATANKRVLIGTQSFAALGLVTPDYVVPDRFLPVDGGVLDYAGVDQLNFPGLPTDGALARFRDGHTDTNRAFNFDGKAATVPASLVTAVEFYHAGLDHYFVSALAPDIDALDGGRIAGWVRTGQTFKVAPSQAVSGGTSPVCRFYIPPQHGNSHFFSASPAECAAVQQLSGSDPNYSGYVFESPAVFYVGLPDGVTGACPPGTQPVYRLWNGRADSNHRYTTSTATKAEMLAHGAVAEGYGPNAVGMCAPL